MNGENIKKVYVVNLDNKRIVVLAGLFFLLFSLAFVAGLKWNMIDEHNAVNVSQSPLDSSMLPQDRDLSSTQIVKDSNALMLPEEDTKIFERKEKKVKEDPFLVEPPVHSIAKEAKIPNSSKKYSSVPNEKESIATDSNEKYYTIQIAAFHHEKDAISYKGILKKQGIDSRVDKGKSYYYVRAGKSSDKKSLQPLVKKINSAMKTQAIVVQTKIS